MKDGKYQVIHVRFLNITTTILSNLPIQNGDPSPGRCLKKLSGNSVSKEKSNLNSAFDNVELPISNDYSSAFSD